jgi:nucleoside-diphosphate-sugar epimerase
MRDGLARGARIPGGKTGVLSWIEAGDAANATVLALERGRPGEIYNIVDDHPTSFVDFANALARAA